MEKEEEEHSGGLQVAGCGICHRETGSAERIELRVGRDVVGRAQDRSGAQV